MQEHFIQRYSDRTVVSHNEAVEELVDIVMAADLPEGTVNHSWQCWNDKHDWCSGKDKTGHPCHCSCNHPHLERSVQVVYVGPDLEPSGFWCQAHGVLASGNPDVDCDFIPLYVKRERSVEGSNPTS